MSESTQGPSEGVEDLEGPADGGADGSPASVMAELDGSADGGGLRWSRRRGRWWRGATAGPTEAWTVEPMEAQTVELTEAQTVELTEAQTAGRTVEPTAGSRR